MRYGWQMVSVLILAQCVPLAAYSQTIYERIDSHFEQKLLEFVDVVESEDVDQIVAGRVTAISAELYEQENPYTEPKYSRHVGRRISLDVNTTWKGDKVVDSIMTHGGMLPKELWEKDPTLPHGCEASNDVLIEEGQNVIIALDIDGPFRADPVWTYGGRVGCILTDLTCNAFNSGDAEEEFTPEVLRYLEMKKEDFIKSVRGYLDTRWQNKEE